MSRPRRNEGWNRLFEVAASTHQISQFDIPDDSDVSVRNEGVYGRDPSDGTFQPEDSRRRRSDRRIAAETLEARLPPARILRCVGRPRCTAPHRGAEPRRRPSRPRSVGPSGSDCQPGNRGTPRGSRPTPPTQPRRADSIANSPRVPLEWESSSLYHGTGPGLKTQTSAVHARLRLRTSTTRRTG